MKTKEVHRFGVATWQLLTEVPGWPDAPRAARIRRVLPFVIPIVAALALLGWNAVVRNPHAEEERAAHQALLALEQEIAALRLDCSDQQAEDTAERAEAAERLVLDEPAQLAPIVRALKKQANTRLWKGDFHATDVSEDPIEPASLIMFLPVRAKLAADSLNPAPFASLVGLLQHFSTMEQRIDLTRLVIRADEQGRYAMELNLRLACHPPHEKTPQ